MLHNYFTNFLNTPNYCSSINFFWLDYEALAFLLSHTFFFLLRRNILWAGFMKTKSIISFSRQVSKHERVRNACNTLCVYHWTQLSVICRGELKGFNWQMSTFRSYEFCSKCINMGAVFDLLSANFILRLFRCSRRVKGKKGKYFSREFQLTGRRARKRNKTEARQYIWTHIFLSKTWKDCLRRESVSKGEARKMDENAKIIDDPSAFVSVDHAKGEHYRKGLRKGDKAKRPPIYFTARGLFHILMNIISLNSI